MKQQWKQQNGQTEQLKSLRPHLVEYCDEEESCKCFLPDEVAWTAVAYDVL
jgi:hypothetical protein